MITDVEAYVPNWPGPKQHAEATAAIIRPFCSVTILDNPDDYFNAQWHRARTLFLSKHRKGSLKSNALLWVMADIWPPKNFQGMLDAGRHILSFPDVGWYAPDVAWTSYIYDDKYSLPCLIPQVFEVPNTDSLCFMIRGDVVEAMPFIDPKVSFMWGMDFIAIATAKLLNLKAVRDYRFKAEHPNSTNYNIDAASQGMVPLFESLDPKLLGMVKWLIQETERLRHPLPKAPPGPSGSLSDVERNQIESARQFKRTNQKPEPQVSSGSLSDLEKNQIESAKRFKQTRWVNHKFAR